MKVKDLFESIEDENNGGDEDEYQEPQRMPSHNQLFTMLDKLEHMPITLNGKPTTFATWVATFDKLPYQEQEKFISGQLLHDMIRVLNIKTKQPFTPKAMPTTIALVKSVLENENIKIAVKQISHFVTRILHPMNDEQQDMFFDYLLRGGDGYSGSKADPHQYATMYNVVSALDNALDNKAHA